MLFFRFHQVLVLAITLLVNTTVSANGPWFFRLGLESGGDELIEVTFDDGDRKKIKAGGLIHFQLGKQFNLFANNPALLTEFSAGYKFDSVNASNGDLKFSRFTINALQLYQLNKKIKFGLGVTYHIDPTLEVNAFGINGEVETDNALGFILNADYSFSDKVSVGVRIIEIDYELDNIEDTSGNSSGVYFSRYF